MTHKMKFYGLQGYRMEKISISDADAELRRQANKKRQLAFTDATYRPHRKPWLPKQTQEEKKSDRLARDYIRRENKFDKEFGPERRFWRNQMGVNARRFDDQLALARMRKAQNDVIESIEELMIKKNIKSK